MTCNRIDFGNGAWGFYCDRSGKHRKAGPCADCGRPHTKLCDYPLRGKKAGKTCSRKMCDAHAVKMARRIDGDTVDYCKAHAAEPAQKELSL